MVFSRRVNMDGVVIKERTLEITKNGLKTIITRGEVKRITWAKGCPITIEFSQSEKVDVPEIDVIPLQFRNEIMNWNLK